MSVRLTLFGRIRVDADGDEHRLSPLTAAVLARLLLAEGQLVTAAELARAVWPGRPGRVTRADRVAVQKRISELRRLLDPEHPGEASPVLRTDRGAVTAYRLVIEREMVDVFCFADLAGQACSATPDAAAGLRRRALALWRDRPLLDVEDHEFAIGFIRRLQQLRDDLEQAGTDRVSRALVTAGRFPPRASVIAVPRELPPALRGFAGRDDELARLDDMLSVARQHPVAMPVIALSGVAGVGKTTLAVQWAHQVSSMFSDGQLYVDLRGFGPGPAMEPDEAVRGFLASLGVTPEAMPGQLAAQTGLYRSMLAGRRMLVLLRLATGTLWVPIGLHAAWDFIENGIVTTRLLPARGPMPEQTAADWFIPVLIIAAALLIARWRGPRLNWRSTTGRERGELLDAQVPAGL